MYRAKSVARYIIQRCHSQNRAISNLKLQKILYFVQAEFLVRRNQPCFAEQIEAWDFGPVVPEVYWAYKNFGSSNIPFFRKPGDTVVISEDDQELINAVVDACASYSASALVNITHHQAPWSSVYEPGKNNIITCHSIQEYFSEG